MNMLCTLFYSTTSGDMTMATWGGSTADNLESIEEDENGSGAGQGPEEEEVDDGGYYNMLKYGKTFHSQ